YRFAGGAELDVDGVEETATRVSALFGRHAQQAWRAQQSWRALFRTAEAAWPTVYRQVLSVPPASLGQLAARAPALGPVLRMTPWRSLSTVAARRFADPRLRAFLERYATYAGADPRRASAMLAVIPYLELAFGAWHVRGGLYRIAEALAARCAWLGVDIRLGARVDRVEVAGDRATGVRLDDGAVLPADVVVANADAADVYRTLLPAGRRHATPAAVRRARPSLAGFVLLLGLRGRTHRLAHHTVLFPRRYHAEFDAIFSRAPRPPDDPTLYVCAPGDPSLRPAGHEGWFVLVNAPAHGGGPYHFNWSVPGVAQRYRDRVLDLLAVRGLPVRDRLLFCEVRTPADLARDAAAPGGAIYGAAPAGPWSGLSRPPNRSPLPNLFLVGGSVHPGGGLPLVALSAKIVAGLVGPA
ncbi:MAG TPA: phytoene desaturase family protein, partial [Micromonosporaceae bacterium]|nr:phytoene desaturase family protein [Micromonosporaceae bacterium]